MTDFNINTFVKTDDTFKQNTINGGNTAKKSKGAAKKSKNVVKQNIQKDKKEQEDKKEQDNLLNDLEYLFKDTTTQQPKSEEQQEKNQINQEIIGGFTRNNVFYVILFFVLIMIIIAIIYFIAMWKKKSAFTDKVVGRYIDVKTDKYITKINILSKNDDVKRLSPLVYKDGIYNIDLFEDKIIDSILIDNPYSGVGNGVVVVRNADNTVVTSKKFKDVKHKKLTFV